jgi:hypothetical protein
MSIWVVNRSFPVGRPVLDYLEFHLADHCNLNCAGCTHFAPYADRRFADLGETRRDFIRLKELFSNIRHIRIMGGEPLLHSEAAEFVCMVREAFPRSCVRLVTNGIKLLDGNDPGVAKTLSALKETGAGVDWACYPPMAGRREEIVRVCEEAGVDLRITENDTFWARLRVKGDADPAASFRWCRKCTYCPIMDGGRIYVCAQARYARYYNRAAGTALDVLEQTGCLATCRCIFHWFSGSTEDLWRAIRAGCWFSVNEMQASTRRAKEQLKLIPKDRLLLETDLPPEQGIPFTARQIEASLLRARELVRTIRTREGSSPTGSPLP